MDWKKTGPQSSLVQLWSFSVPGLDFKTLASDQHYVKVNVLKVDLTLTGRLALQQEYKEMGN